MTGPFYVVQAYRSGCTHLIIPKVLGNEKFLAACAAGMAWWFSDCNTSFRIFACVISINHKRQDCHNLTWICMRLSIWLLLFLSQLGNWVVTPDYVLDSVKNGSWLSEETYEIAISTHTATDFYPVRPWREKVASGSISGAFQGWKVLLMVKEPIIRSAFKRWGSPNSLVPACDNIILPIW